MSLLAVGLNHRTASNSLLELAAVSGDDAPKVLGDLVQADHIVEAVVLSTCNRTEIYAEVDTFHGGLADISDQLARVCGVELSELSPHLYVHHEARAVGHLFAVVCGLDSMLVGESQILGQVRAAFRGAQAAGAAGGALAALFQTALRVGKRAHTETSIDAAGASIVSVGLQIAAGSLDVRRPERLSADVTALGDATVLGDATALADVTPSPGASAAPLDPSADLPLDGCRVLIIGAGAVGGLTAATVRRAGARELAVANRTPARAAAIADNHGARVVGLADLAREIGLADLVVSSTGATGLVVAYEMVEQALAARSGRPLVFLDLALPHDIDPAVRELPGVVLVDLESLRVALEGAQVSHDMEAVRALVSAEVTGFLARRGAVRVAPTVVALRAQAAAIASDELDRLRGRLPGLDAREWEMVTGTVRRVVDKLLHAPTVRVQQLANGPGGDSYAEALRELFDLPREVPAVVSAPDLLEQP
ncbi:glutamyl-tRNA reductase [Frankia sp. CNm7]|uniref:Glutamyl-tRNA reductase n=1 Tax=Frankia nepalensis TaxID=1836974 RepID=A0A937RT29_9ACTN|nr:glutamyl-tRNA reductase [Frankia nepalensis]MBL7496024.1 glutamyl-tRNA reductase [Frankia nepalensis]MBL7514863.1 glutamyl-tRNA reductase [Frankia nepalensis]MBL7524523.1 glutamyl-tRNA reductase [Frankia nepalensis]MBL7631421.1 glutamyl-tRNA reductase [Frankia nepalensis]